MIRLGKNIAIDTKNIGIDLAVVGSVISIAGVILNNVFLMHHTAMQVWIASNTIFMIYFYGNWKRWWDGGLSSEAIFLMYCVMWISGIYGLYFIQ